MDSTFLEKIVVKNKTPKDYLRIAGVAALFFVIFFASFIIDFLRPLAPLLIIGSGWGSWWLITSLNKEYEYIVTDNFIDIDCIIAQRRRKRVFSGDAKQVEYLAKISDSEFASYQRGHLEVLDFAPTEKKKDNYFLVTVNKAKKTKTTGKQVMVIFEPSDKMMNALKKYNPSKIKI